MKLPSCLLPLLAALLLAAAPAQAQRRNKKQPPPPAAAEAPAPAPAAETMPPVANAFAVQRQVFEQALAYNDGEVAVGALYEMMALQPANEALKDTLAYLYYNLNKYASVLFVTREITARQPSNLGALELRALAEKNLGLQAEALASYEKLYLNTQDIYHLYEQVSLQYQLSRFNEMDVTLDMLLSHPDVDQQTITLQASQRNSQEVPMRAAALNLRGVLQAERNQKAQARASYQQALKLLPDFVLAKSNLAALDQPPAKK